jgi:hypothetical protein
VRDKTSTVVLLVDVITNHSVFVNFKYIVI